MRDEMIYAEVYILLPGRGGWRGWLGYLLPNLPNPIEFICQEEGAVLLRPGVHAGCVDVHARIVFNPPRSRCPPVNLQQRRTQ